jgi:hypothetical protein
MFLSIWIDEKVFDYAKVKLFNRREYVIISSLINNSLLDCRSVNLSRNLLSFILWLINKNFGTGIQVVKHEPNPLRLFLHCHSFPFLSIYGNLWRHTKHTVLYHLCGVFAYFAPFTTKNLDIAHRPHSAPLFLAIPILHLFGYNFSPLLFLLFLFLNFCLHFLLLFFYRKYY